jgi:hypothetical protein
MTFTNCSLLAAGLVALTLLTMLPCRATSHE